MHEFLEKFLLGQLNLSLLGDNSVEKQMADEIIENGIKDRLKEIWGVGLVYIILKNMLVLLI